MIWKFVASSGFSEFYFPINDQRKLFKQQVAEYFKNGYSLMEMWKPLGLLRKKSKKFPDFFEIDNSGVIAISQTALEESNHFFNDDIELLPLRTDAGEYFAINILKFIDCFNKEISNCKLNEFNTITSYKFIELYEERLEGVHFFKIPELPFTNLVVNDVLEFYEKKAFLGLEFDENVNLL